MYFKNVHKIMIHYLAICDDFVSHYEPEKTEDRCHGLPLSSTLTRRFPSLWSVYWQNFKGIAGTTLDTLTLMDVNIEQCFTSRSAIYIRTNQSGPAVYVNISLQRNVIKASKMRVLEKMFRLLGFYSGNMYGTFFLNYFIIRLAMHFSYMMQFYRNERRRI